MDILYLRAKFGRDRWTYGERRKKLFYMFFVTLLKVGLLHMAR